MPPDTGMIFVKSFSPVTLSTNIIVSPDRPDICQIFYTAVMPMIDITYITFLQQVSLWGRGKKNVRNPEYSGFRLFGRIEWVPPLKIKKLLRVMRRTGK